MLNVLNFFLVSLNISMFIFFNSDMFFYEFAFDLTPIYDSFVNLNLSQHFNFFNVSESDLSEIDRLKRETCRLKERYFVLENKLETLASNNNETWTIVSSVFSLQFVTCVVCLALTFCFRDPYDAIQD